MSRLGTDASRSADSRLGRCWQSLGGHPYLVLTLVVAACFAPNLRGYFVEDAFTVLPSLRALTLSEFAGSVIGPGRRWRMAWWAAAYAEARLLPLTPLPHILLGVALFWMLVCCVHAVNRRVLTAPGALMGATLLFALQPQHQGRVFTVGIPFVSLGFAATVWCFTHPEYPRRRTLVWGGIAGLVVTLLSYEPNLFVAAPIVAVSALLYRHDREKSRRRQLAWRIGPAVLGTMVYAGLRFGVFKDFGGVNISASGESTSLLARPGAGAFLTAGIRLLSGVVSNLDLLYAAHHPLVGRIGWLYAGLVALLLAMGRGWRRTWPVALWLGAWWLASFVPLIDVLPQRNPESRYFFWPTWPFAVLLAAVGPDPARSRWGARLWAACVGIVLVASLSETWVWRSRFAQARTLVASFHESVPAPEESTGVYVLDAPSEIADFLMFTSLPDALLLPYSDAARSQLAVWPARAQPPHYPERVPDHVPIEQVSRIVVRRWNAAEHRWEAEALPAWAWPRPAGTPDIADWTCPPSLERQGWEPNPHVLSLRTQGLPCVWQVAGSYPLLFAGPWAADPIPVAYAEVTMAVRSPTAVNYAEWLFLTPGHQTYAGNRVERFRVTADGATHTYAVPLLRNPAAILDGPITHLAFRPPPVRGTAVRIERVRLIPWKAPPQPAK